MSNSDRWRRWRPPGKNSVERGEQTPPQPTEWGAITPDEGYVSCGGVWTMPTQEFCRLTTLGLNRPREDFHRWMLDRCAYESRSFSRIDELCRDFRAWSLDRNEVPFTTKEFVRLLSETGFFLANGLVSGIVLREDGPRRRGVRASRMDTKEGESFRAVRGQSS